MNLNDFWINAYKNGSGTSVYQDAEKKGKESHASKNNYGKTDSSSASENVLDAVFSKKDSGFTGNVSAKIATHALTSGGLIKVPVMPRGQDGKENIYRRVAKFLLLVGIDEAAKILQHLTAEQTEKIIPEIASIRYVSPVEATEILEEFKGLVKKAREGGGIDTARTILEKAFGADKADDMLEKAVPLKNSRPFDYLSEADSERVSFLLHDESNAVKSLVLSFLKPKIAAGVINALEDDDKKEVVLRLAKRKEISPEIIKRIDSALQEKMNRIAASKSDSMDGTNVLAQILKRMSPNAEQEILSRLSEQNPELGDDLRERLFTIDDVVASDDRFIQEKLRNMDEESIAYLIARKSVPFREKILSNVSENRRKSILETEQFLKPMRRSDCDTATSQFIAFLRRAYEEGSLIIKGRDDEIYV